MDRVQHPRRRDEPAAARVLYIHPHGHLNDLVIPAGAISVMNAIDGPRLGRYAFEVTDQEIAEAGVIALDLHWSCGITGFEPMVARIRAVNPKAVLVVGGITAGLAPRTILARYPVDYVIQGDAEAAFADLVAAVRQGRTPDGIPNVHGQADGPGHHRRISRTAFDRTDCLTIDWFPTYKKLSGLQAAAFGVGRTVPIVRGCRMRCPHCYGSYASTFGRGTLTRSPASFRALMVRAEQERVEGLRLILGKPSSATLSRLLGALRGLRLSRMPSAVGVFLCTPPSLDDLAILEQALPTGVHLSLVPPNEHQPTLSDRQMNRELARWERVASTVAASPTLRMDIWTDAESGVAAPSRRLQEVGSTHAQLSRSTVWHMPRIVDRPGSPGWDKVRSAVLPIWTFYASKLLSPSLADLLAPYHLLDELEDPPPQVHPPPGPLEVVHEELISQWHATRLPTLPNQTWWALPVSLTGTLEPGDPRNGVRTLGHLGLGRLGVTVRPLPCGPRRMTATIDDRGVRLSAPLDPLGDGMALLPAPSADEPPDEVWVQQLLERGVCILDLRRGNPPIPSSVPGGRFEVVLRVQDARVAALDSDGNILVAGRSDLNYFRKPVASSRLPSSDQTHAVRRGEPAQGTGV